MGAVHTGEGFAANSVAAAAAGVDLLLLTDSGAEYEAVYGALLGAAQDGRISRREVDASAGRVLALKAWADGREQPDLPVVGCAEHLALAREIAARSVTLVRDRAAILPLELAAEERVLAVVPRPRDLTPADTSSYETPRLAEALRRHHPNVEELLVPLDPSPEEVAAVRERAGECALTVAATINARDYPGQAAMLNALLVAGARVVACALRLPYDLAAYPSAPTYVCTYSLQPPSLEALADALWGRIPFGGVLPVAVPGI
jgi:beta-N-acetylhexosaminidase